MDALAVRAQEVGFRYRGTGLRYRGRHQRTAVAPHQRTAVAPHQRTGSAPQERTAGIVDVDLVVGRGEIIGLLGPNGGGKSTLLRLLATALRPRTGDLQLLGRHAHPATRALRRAIGYAADAPVHVDGLSGRSNAIAFARAAGMSDTGACAAVDALLDRFDLAADADRPVREYSHGMRRKVLLAEALAHDPELLVLDEPTLGLDPPACATLGTLLHERAGAGAAVILATHDLDLASRLCDRVVFMLDGRVALDGRPDALLRGIDAGTRIRIALRTPLLAPLPLNGMPLVRQDDGTIELRAPAGAAALPDLCALLVRESVQIHTIELHEPDLRDVFMSVTGRTWSDAS